MADLGILGTAWEIEAAPRVAQGGFPGPRELVIWGETAPLVIGAGRSNSEGTPAAPSLYMPRGGRMQFRLPINAGPRSVSVYAKQPDVTVPRPSLRILRNDEIGVDSELSATAPNGTGWVQIGPISFVADADGGIVIELAAGLSYGLAADCWFDRVFIT